MQQLDKIKQLTANIGDTSTQYHGQMIGEAVVESGQQPDLRHKYPQWH